MAHFVDANNLVLILSDPPKLVKCELTLRIPYRNIFESAPFVIVTTPPI